MINKDIDYKNSATVWEYIEQDIELKVLKGELKIGEKVNSVRELAELYNVSCNTSKKALETLYKNGLLEKKQGIGYFIKEYDIQKLENKYYSKLQGILTKSIELANKMGMDNINLKRMIDDL